jgi:hypothetical protein
MDYAHLHSRSGIHGEQQPWIVLVVLVVFMSGGGEVNRAQQRAGGIQQISDSSQQPAKYTRQQTADNRQQAANNRSIAGSALRTRAPKEKLTPSPHQQNKRKERADREKRKKKKEIGYGRLVKTNCVACTYLFLGSVCRTLIARAELSQKQ